MGKRANGRINGGLPAADAMHEDFSRGHRPGRQGNEKIANSTGCSPKRVTVSDANLQVLRDLASTGKF